MRHLLCISRVSYRDFYIYIRDINGSKVPLHVCSSEYYVLKAGLLSIIFMPLIMAFVGITQAPLLWFPVGILTGLITRKSNKK